MTYTTLSSHELHNSVVLQPSVSDKVLPLVLLDIRQKHKFKHSHIRWGVHLDLSSVVIPDTEQVLEAKEIQQILEHLEKKCFTSGNASGPFHWRRISSVVILGDPEDKPKMLWLYNILKQEAKTRQLSIFDETFETFVKQYPYLRSNSSHIQDEFDIPSLILERDTPRYRLYVGSHRSSKDKTWVSNLGIKSILNCAHECECVLEQEENAPLYLHLPLRDALDQEITNDTITQAAKYIHDQIQHGNVLVHCLEGRSRSVTITCAYLMIYHKWTSHQCLDYFKLHRPLARPNPTFVKFLHEINF